MGGIGSGRRHQGGKGTTSAYRSLDVRRLHRDGLLAPGQAFGWNWTRDRETLAAIFIRTEADKVTFVGASVAGMAGRLRLMERGLGGLLDDLDVEW
jgi:hypothetical protein